MKGWYIPSFNGDVRLVPHPDGKKTILTATEPTVAELQDIKKLGEAFVGKGWLSALPSEPAEGFVVDAPIEVVGPVVAETLRPGPAVLTAIRLHDGQVEVCEHSVAGEGKTGKELAKLAAKPAEAAATVKRPTPSCPDCYVDAVAPASEVLLSFLTEPQHFTWSQGRYVVIRGGLTGHVYVVAHRSSEIASKNGRICWDATDKDTLHFHDQSVPPEEEVLAAMLILQHREPWLRNEATCLGLRFSRVFKNPFGDHMDGVADAAMTRMAGMIGMALRGDS